MERMERLHTTYAQQLQPTKPTPFKLRRGPVESLRDSLQPWLAGDRPVGPKLAPSLWGAAGESSGPEGND